MLLVGHRLKCSVILVLESLCKCYLSLKFRFGLLFVHHNSIKAGFGILIKFLFVKMALYEVLY